jgi:hypothetical protein
MVAHDHITPTRNIRKKRILFTEQKEKKQKIVFFAYGDRKRKNVICMWSGHTTT